MPTEWSKVKMEYVPANTVPTGRTITSRWNELFSSIPKGQALVLHEPQVSSSTVRTALKARHRKGEFKNIQMTTKGAHGSATIYIINTEKERTPTYRVVQPPKSES